MFRCFSSPRYFVPLPAGHVFPMRKFPDSVARLIADGTIGTDQITDPGLIVDADLFRVHTRDYVESIRSGGFNEATKLKLGLPPSDALSIRSHCAVAGTLAAARAALANGIAANLAGGTHHAFPDRGEGFCVFNDVAVAIRALRSIEPYLQTMIVDLDAHQGNGTNFIFREDRSVYTYSIHVGRNYPSRKEPGTQDVELARFAPSVDYFAALGSTLPIALETFEPDLIFYIAGADAHIDDQFGQMTLSTDEMARRDRWTINLFRDQGIPTVVLYGGGYNKVPSLTTDLHCQTIRIAAARFASDSA